MILLTQDPIDVAAVLQSARSPQAGATALFLGSVRSPSCGRTVAYLHYECYGEMAQSILEQLAVEAQARWNLLGCAMTHRIGRVAVGEISLAIVCSAAHREPAFQAVQWLIDQIKEQVPLWKKEFFTDGTSLWVSHNAVFPPETSGRGGSGGGGIVP